MEREAWCEFCEDYLGDDEEVTEKTLEEPETMAAYAGIGSLVIECKIIRANGQVEDLGVVSEWHADQEAPALTQ